MSEITIPPKNRIEWRKMVIGEIEHKYSNFVLQMKVHQANKDIVAKRTSVSEAIDEIYTICSKYALAVQNDVKIIFKSW